MRIMARRLEINIVDHCNLSCRACSHLSPSFPRRAVDPADIARDLEPLARVYHAHRVRLLGGEPLLHDDIDAVIDVVRGLGIADEIELATNGVLLGRMAMSTWERLDRVDVSAYPSRGPSDETLSIAQQRAAVTSTALHVRRPAVFRESYSEVGTDDTRLVQRIFDTCRIAHEWECHTVADGRLYRCGPSHFVPRIVEDADPQERDGLRIHGGPTFADEVAAFLAGTDPLASCRFCLGSAGRLFDHEQVNPRAFRSHQQAPTEQLVDRWFLRYLELIDRLPRSRDRLRRHEWGYRAVVNRLRGDGIRALRASDPAPRRR
jgi:uncharacterized Fe-S cluster-containing radical SAM superfamily protein